MEDEALVRIATKASLQALGYQVITAGHGYEALDHLEANPDIALIITDIAMPETATIMKAISARVEKRLTRFAWRSASASRETTKATRPPTQIVTATR